MASETPNMTKTEKNLWSAIVGEALAYLKYNAYAHRALEEGLPVIRSTPTGISAVVDADGRLIDSIAHHKAGHIDAVLPRAHAATPFALWGNAAALGLAGLLLLFAVALRAFRR
jgi:apolipoprotein N-acyltransferase